MGRKYNTRKRARSTRTRRRQIKKPYKHRKGGTKYNSGLDFPFIFTYQDITDNIDNIEQLQNPKNINSYEVGRVYMIQFTNDAQNYYHYRVKNIDPGIGAPRAPPEAPLGALVVVPAIPKGKNTAV
jgi:hypothetical protein